MVFGSEKQKMDLYKVLEVNRSATKEEIKEAFRKLALKYHPDKHSQSPKPLRDSATLQFKQVSEAYEVLGDDCKRANYNLMTSSSSYNHSHRYRNASSASSSSSYYHRYRSASNSSSSKSHSYSYHKSSDLWHIGFRFLTTRTFLLNLAFASALFGGIVAIDTGREALWKMFNSGKSFEEAMESLEKSKAHRDT